jgi:uncharacterized membrane protein YgcG
MRSSPRNSRLLPLASALAIAAVPALAAAAARSLHWNLLDVDARLDAAGDLHVVELQEMVFSGDWNGGERTFRVGRGQRLRLERVLRVGADGEARPLEEGSLDAIDRYAWAGQDTLRWRSRLPSDPPFDSTTITYVLQYTVSGVVVAGDEGGFRLAHDFAFSDRPGAIREVRARLALDPSWQTSAPLALHRADLPPGEGAVLDVPLTWGGAGAAPVPAPATAAALPASLRGPLLAAMLAALALAAAWVWRHGRRRGFFEPLPEGEVDEAFLRRHVLAHPPEVVGAAWDERIGAPEVSAVLARLAAEGKLSGRLERRALRKGVLHLELLVGRETLGGYDRTLVDALFFDGNAVDSERLREQYRKSGFDPSGLVSQDVRAKARALAPAGTRGGRLWWLGGAALLAALSAAIRLSALARGVDLEGMVPPALVGPLLFLVATGFAASFSHAVAGRALRAAGIVAPLLLWMGWLGRLAWGGHASPAAVLSHALLWGATVLFVAGLARTPLPAAALATRRRLEAARRWFVRELARPVPALADEWIPYLVALGLGGDLDRWLRVHGAAATAGALARTGTGSGSGAARWTGGGGRFSGGGASGTWAALGSFSAGVSAPSSGGSRGGSSGGSRSGGGGGGGW